jgi:hypothetical protein
MSDSSAVDDKVDDATKTPPKEVKEPEVKIEHLENLKREILHDITELHAKDDEEKAALKKDVERLTAYIDQLEEARLKRDSIKPDDTTIVLPPNDIPIQQPNAGNEPPPATSGGPAKKKKLGWW